MLRVTIHFWTAATPPASSPVRIECNGLGPQAVSSPVTITQDTEPIVRGSVNWLKAYVFCSEETPFFVFQQGSSPNFRPSPSLPIKRNLSTILPNKKFKIKVLGSVKTFYFQSKRSFPYIAVLNSWMSASLFSWYYFFLNPRMWIISNLEVNKTHLPSEGCSKHLPILHLAAEEDFHHEGF